MEQVASFGYWLRRRRKTLDLTQEELARLAGCALGTIRKIEADERRPSREMAARLADCLGIAGDERAAFLKAARAVLAADQLAPPAASPSSAIATPHTDIPRENQLRALHGYELCEQLGAGSFGVVYRAIQPGIGRTVALKIIRPEYANLPDFIRRFERETQLIARLEHPHIVPLYDYWRDPSGAYLVMRYVDGGSLRAALGHGPWSLDQTTRLLEQIGAALALSHQHGVVHRDIKPANILLDATGNAYLADFGIAKELHTAEGADDAQPGVLIGSPDSLSPEQLRDEPVTAQSDIYSLGLLLYAVLTGAPAFTSLAPADRLRQQLGGRLPPLRSVRADLPDGLASVIERATAKAPADRYPDVLSLMHDWQHEIPAGVPPTPAERPMQSLPSALADPHSAPEAATLLDLVAIKNPYKGLRAFGEADADDYFGRESLVQRLLERLEASGDGAAEMGIGDRVKASGHPPNPGRPSPIARFLAVVGPSGSGKSSVVRAGLIPALRRGGLDGSEQWFVVDLFPGAHPLEELEAALLRVAVQPPESLLGQLREDERGLARAIKRVLPANPLTELVLVIDQFEELFTLTADPAIREHVLKSLVAAIDDPRSRVRVIITIRADFIDRPLQYVEFGALLRERTEFVLPLAPDEVERAIVGPARRAGLTIEPDLVVAIADDVGAQPGALPLLQYALTELFERRQGTVLTLPSYRASGGIRGALARRADALYSALDAAGQAAVQQLFLRLITLGEGVEDTRRRTPQVELLDLDDSHLNNQETSRPGNITTDTLRASPSASLLLSPLSAMATVIDRYGRARLLSFDHDPITRAPTVEVAHEALLGAWGRLRGWLDAGRADVRALRLLAAAAAEWGAAKHDQSYLLAGARLTQFENWAAQTSLALTPGERAFLEASLTERERRAVAEREDAERELAKERAMAQAQRSAARRLRYLVGALALFLVAAIGISSFAVEQSGVAERERGVAERERGVADQQRQTAAANAAEAEHERELVQADLLRAEAQRLGVEASRLVARQGNVDLATLLAIRSIRTQYTPQGDEAIEGAAQLPYPARVLRTNIVNRSVRFSSNGQYLLAGGDSVVWLWDVRTGQEPRHFAPLAGTVNDLAFSPDGLMIALGYDGGSISIESVTGRRELQRLTGHSGAVNGVVFAPDGRSIITGSSDQTVRIWDVQTGRQIRTISAPQPIVALALSPDGRIIATGDGVVGKNSIRLWDAQTGTAIRTMAGHSDSIRHLDFSPDGVRLLSASTDTTARIWDVATGLEILSIAEPDGVQGAAFAPDGRTFITAGNDKIIRLRDSATGRELQRLNTHTDIVYGVAFAPNGQLVASASKDGTVRLWNIHVRPGLPQLVGHPDPIAGAALTSDGKTLVTVGTGLTLRVWDTATGTQQRTLEGLGGVGTGVAISPNNRLVAGTGNAVYLWDLPTGALIDRLMTGSTATLFGVAFSPDGHYLATVGRGGGTATVWDLRTRRQLATLNQPNGRPVAFSPDSKLLLTGSDNGYARLWDISSNITMTRAFEVDGSEAMSVAFTADRHPITGSNTGVVEIWDLNKRRAQRRFVGHVGAIQSLAVSPDGRYLLTASDDQTARLWDIQTGAELRRFAGHTGPVTVALFSPDGRMVLTGSGDRTARLWYTSIEDTVKLLCGRLLRDFTPDERAQYAIADTTPTCPATK
jgi:WD40 repeat protein/transcriptional regulator with XRE-family HTH domain